MRSHSHPISSRATTVMDTDPMTSQPICDWVSAISSRTIFMSGAIPNQEKKQRKNANHVMWNARICGVRMEKSRIRVALPVTSMSRYASDARPCEAMRRRCRNGGRPATLCERCATSPGLRRNPPPRQRLPCRRLAMQKAGQDRRPLPAAPVRLRDPGVFRGRRRPRGRRIRRPEDLQECGGDFSDRQACQRTRTDRPIRACQARGNAVNDRITSTRMLVVFHGSTKETPPAPVPRRAAGRTPRIGRAAGRRAFAARIDPERAYLRLRTSRSGSSTRIRRANRPGAAVAHAPDRSWHVS